MPLMATKDKPHLNPLQKKGLWALTKCNLLLVLALLPWRRIGMR
jgi:hypothetical protein